MVERLRESSADQIKDQVRSTLFETNLGDNMSCWGGLSDTFQRVEIEVESGRSLRGEIATVKLTS